VMQLYEEGIAAETNCRKVRREKLGMEETEDSSESDAQRVLAEYRMVLFEDRENK